jgi:hypothetical protein
MHYAVDHVGRIGVRRRARGLEATALIDGDVHHDRALLHLLHHRTAHELRRRRAGNEHRADHKVGRKNVALDRVPARMHRDHARPEFLFYVPENLDRAVQRINPRARAHRHADRARSGDARAEHGNLRRRHPRNAAEQDPHAAALLL